MNTFHLLAFPKDTTIKSIRDLTQEHVPLLKNMVSKCKKYIVDNYNLNEDKIEAHFHYPPGVMLLHMHFELCDNIKNRKNLLIDSDYYKKVTIETIINEL